MLIEAGETKDHLMLPTFVTNFSKQKKAAPTDTSTYPREFGCQPQDKRAARIRSAVNDEDARAEGAIVHTREARLAHPSSLEVRGKPDKDTFLSVKGQITDIIIQLQRETTPDANHKSCHVHQKLHKENIQSTFLPSAASRPDKVVGCPVEMRRQVSMIREVPKTIEVPQDQFIDKAAECAPVDFSPAMAGRIARRGLVAYTFKSTLLTLPTRQTHARVRALRLTHPRLSSSSVGPSKTPTVHPLPASVQRPSVGHSRAHGARRIQNDTNHNRHRLSQA